ncbi:MAG TPA: HD domain-containing phosphohydrolase [Patescibacteria group bacterium]|nr:HD domain-containing phosphohydrolase [Patescibacteria group bacterium]
MDKKETRRTIKQRVEHLVAGMELARDVLSPEGTVLVGEGSIISQHTINKLKQWQIPDVYTVAEIPVHQITDPLAKAFVDTYNQSIDTVKTAFDQTRDEQEVATDTFRTTAGNLTESLQAVGNAVDFLYDVTTAETELHRHSVNVSVLGTLIAVWMKLPPETVSAISLAGLMHDLGKTRLPQECMQHPQRLTTIEMEEYKKHAQYGFELVRQIPEISGSITQAILQHHERMDGTGYPYGIKSEKIHPYAQILAVADTYDTAMRVKKNQDLYFSPYAGLESLWTQIHCLPVNICVIFKQRMADYLGGNRVMLTDGREGRVVFLEPEIPWLSVVQMDDGTVLNLRIGGELCIHHVLR